MLYVFLEGPDDERFFKSVYGPVFNERFGACKFIRCAGMKSKKLNDFLRALPFMPDSKYFFFKDADRKEIDERKQILIGKYANLSGDCTFVVQEEIESWYYAGIAEDVCRQMRLKHYEYRTDTLTKEAFYEKMPSRADRVALMEEILARYSLTLAVKRNRSLYIFDQALRSA